MNIQLSDHVALKLMTIANITEGLEFSGFGFVDLNDDVIYVYDVVVILEVKYLPRSLQSRSFHS